jgi:hypothetical protein
MPTEDQIRKHVQNHIETAQGFVKDHANAIEKGCSVNDDISVNVRDACGHPTALLVRTYSHPTEQWKPLRSTFDIRLLPGNRDWSVRCSSGLPGPDRD